METNLPTTTIARPSAERDPAPHRTISGHDRRLDGPRLLTNAHPEANPYDRLIATLLLIPALPVILIVCALVKLTSRGPAYYSQRRVGRDGRVFYIHKIRTMTWNCESGTGAVWAVRNDPRVTPLGRFLRATHLDELPQLFNVLDGEMAMVGPRPERPEIIERLLPEVPGYLERLSVLPGVTGLAQVSYGADQTIDDVRKKLEFDRHYIQRKSIWLDFRIMACTLIKMLHLNFRWVRAILLPESRLGVTPSVDSQPSQERTLKVHRPEKVTSESA